MMDVYTAIAQPRRRSILDALIVGERPVGDLVDELDMDQPTVSKHLRTLRAAGVVRSRVDGPRRLYRLEPAPLAEIDAWLNAYRQFWSQKLDALQAHLDDKEPS